MDIKERIEQILTNEYYYGYTDGALRAQGYPPIHDKASTLTQIVSLFEPVTLEPLTDAERNAVCIPCETCSSTCDFRHPSVECMECIVKCHAQATIAKNSNGQLYRVKEG
jgi:hypothetical protein